MMVAIRIPVMAFAALVAGALTLGTAGTSNAGETAIDCTNPASGVKWQIVVDVERGTVDSNPAEISDSKISWDDPKDGGHYTLDRESGRLRMVAASSTGGYMLFDRCKPKN